MSGHFYKSPYLVKSPRLARQSVTRTVGVTDSPLLGPNPRRRGLILCAPAADRDPYQRLIKSVFFADAGTTGDKLVYTCPAGTQAEVVTGQIYFETGTPLVNYFVVVAGQRSYVQTFSATGSHFGVFMLQGGDQAGFQCMVAGAAGAGVDCLVSVRQLRAQDRYTVGFAGPAVLDAGPTVYPGAEPLCVLQGEVAQSVTEEVRAVSANAPQSVTVIELFDFLEELPRGRHP
jgi:hypothetical protein